MANPPKPWIVDYAKRPAKCKTCKKIINKGMFRMGKTFAARKFDGFMTVWNHAGCILRKRGQFQTLHDIKGFDTIRWKDYQEIRKYAEGLGQVSAHGSGGSTADDSSKEYAIENAKNSRATCKICNKKIVKGKVRISTYPPIRRKVRVWNHAKCFLETGLWTSPMEKMAGWDTLTEDDKELVQSMAKPHIQESNQGSQRKSKKRKRDECEALPSKMPKKNSVERKLEKQTNALWKIIDDLEEHVETVELRKMLTANDQDSKGSGCLCRERCADGMLFGALGKCPICGGGFEYSDMQYKCRGHVSAWSRCTFSTTNPERLQGKWKIPEKTKNEYLREWFTSQKGKGLPRLLHPQSTENPLQNQGTEGQPQNSETTILKGLKVAIIGYLNESRVEWKSKLAAAGGKVLSSLTEDADCLVINKSEINTYWSDIENAVRMEVPVVRESFLTRCLEKKMRLRVHRYVIKEASKSALDTVKRRLRGSVVHENSGLQETGHILEEGGCFYNMTLNRCDLASNINSYYILQLIEVKNGKRAIYHIFRKWDRVGNNQVVRQKLEEMPKCDAIHTFKQLFSKHTGNKWENWVNNKDNFEKQPDKFFPLDLDYKVAEPQVHIDNLGAKTKLDPGVLNLMKMLFDPNTYRDAMNQLDIRMPIMPLGKLSKNNIEKGFEALKQVEKMIELNHSDPLKECKLTDANSRFFTLIPTVHPRVIRDPEDVKSKNEMLETLGDIVEASRLISFENIGDDPWYANYEKLHCNIDSLDHDSDDYQLIEKYLKNTHAKTHDKWELEVEDVYAIDREQEYNADIPYKSNLKNPNRMLLWHGSRTTNFLSILSKGLRKAPRQALSTGYMFGKGIYFADIGSKSAKYCYTTEENPRGLILLSEVALGEVYEVKKAKDMDKPPEGKDSTKGVGKFKPLEREYENWRDDVIVPCGHPVSSGVKGCALKYNEYIVYETAQVKLQFLVKVRFIYKKNHS